MTRKNRLTGGVGVSQCSLSGVNLEPVGDDTVCLERC